MRKLFSAVAVVGMLSTAALAGDPPAKHPAKEAKPATDAKTEAKPVDGAKTAAKATDAKDAKAEPKKDAKPATDTAPKAAKPVEKK